MANFFTGSPEGFQQIPRGTPQQQELMSNLLQQLAPMINNQQLGGQGFAPIAQQARRGFAQSTVPSIAERFTAMNGQGSSGFSQALGQAGAGLESNLAAQQSQFDQQSLQSLLSLLSLGLAPQFDTAYRPPEQGFLGGLGSTLGMGLGQGIGRTGLSSLLGLLL